MVNFSYCSFQDEHIDLGKQELSVCEIQQKVKEYNSQTNSNLYMVFVSDKSFLWLFICAVVDLCIT